METDQKITLVNEQNEVIEVELLCAFELEEYHSKYVLYTKNEKDESGHTIIYSGKLTSDGEKNYLNTIDQTEEWDKIKEIMKEMSKYNEEEKQ